jgi:hypothetical protein
VKNDSAGEISLASHYVGAALEDMPFQFPIGVIG